MGNECRSILESASRTVALAFDLVGATAQDLPDLVGRALRSAEVQQAIRDALQEEANRLLRAHPEAIAGGSAQLFDEEAWALAARLGRGTLDAALGRLGSEVLSSPAGRRLRAEAERLVEDLRCSPVGVFVNQNRTLVIVVGSVLALAGGAALYLARWGDPVGRAIQGRLVRVNLGRIALQGQVTRFEPSSRTVGAEITIGTEWQPVAFRPAPGQAGSARLTIAGLARGTTAEATANGQVILPIAPHVSGVLQAGAGVRGVDFGPGPGGAAPSPQFHYSAALGLRVTDQGLSLDLMARLRDGQPGGSLSLGLDRRWGPARVRVEAGVEYRPWAATGTPDGSRFRVPTALPPRVGDLFPSSSDSTFQVGATLRLEF